MMLNLELALEIIIPLGGLMAWMWNRLDKRFDQIDKRFDQIDKRFEQVDKKFETIISEIKEMKIGIGKLEQKNQDDFQAEIKLLLKERK